MTTNVRNSESLRKLIPTYYDFDGYSDFKCPDPRARPFWAENMIPMGNYFLSTSLLNENTLCITLKSPCKSGFILFSPYKLSIDEFAQKLLKASQRNRDYINIKIKPRYHKFKDICTSNKCTHLNDSCVYFKQQRPLFAYATVSFNFSEMKAALAQYYERRAINYGVKLH